MNFNTGLSDKARNGSQSSRLHDATLFALKLRGIECSKESLLHGLPPEEQGTFEGVMRAVHHNVSLNCKCVSIADIKRSSFPCIGEMKGNDAGWVVLESYDAVKDTFSVKTFYETDSNNEQVWRSAELNDYLKTDLLSLTTQADSEDELLANRTNNFSFWLWRELSVLRPVYRDIIIATLMVNLFALASPLFVMNVYDRVVPNLAMETLWVLASGLALVILFELTVKLLRHNFLEQAGKRLDLVLSSKLFSRVLNVRMEAFPSSVGSLASQVKEFDSIKQFFTAATITSLTDLPFALLFLLVISMIGGSIVIVPIVAASVMLIYGFIMHFPIRSLVDSMQQAAADKNSILVESISGVETLKSLNAQGRQQGFWEVALVRLSNLSTKAKHLTDSVAIVSAAIMQLSTMIVVIVGVYLIEQQSLSLGALIACVLLSSRALSPMAQIANLISQYQQAKTAYQGLNALSEKPAENVEAGASLNLEGKVSTIDVRDLVFSYEGGPKVLKELNFSLKAGEKVAIIGKIGSGKSSLLKLLQGFGQLDSGQLLVNGIDVQHLDTAQLRASIAYVPQDITLFKGTLRDNILMKSPHASQASLLQAVEIAGLSEFVQSHEMGLDMPIGEHGKGLSGGQRQCVAIARSVINDPDLLLFDELTSSMDNQTEQLIINNIRNMAEDKILLLSTHRASLLALVDRIIVMDQGKIIADGPKVTVLDAMKRGLIQAGDSSQAQTERKS
jgi:ATP-binding cassette subfamily C protein LapB